MDTFSGRIDEGGGDHLRLEFASEVMHPHALTQTLATPHQHPERHGMAE
jgi:hypothetical protein